MAGAMTLRATQGNSWGNPDNFRSFGHEGAPQTPDTEHEIRPDVKEEVPEEPTMSGARAFGVLVKKEIGYGNLRVTGLLWRYLSICPILFIVLPF